MRGVINTKVKSQGSNNTQNVTEEPASLIGRVILNKKNLDMQEPRRIVEWKQDIPASIKILHPGRDERNRQRSQKRDAERLSLAKQLNSWGNL